VNWVKFAIPVVELAMVGAVVQPLPPPPPPPPAAAWVNATVLDWVDAGTAPVAALQVTDTAYVLCAVVLVLVNVAAILNGVPDEHAAAPFPQSVLPLVKLPVPVPVVVWIDPVHEAAYSGWKANVVPAAVPPAREVKLALKSDAGPNVAAGTDDVVVVVVLPQPVPVGVPVAVACNWPGVALFVT